MSIAGMPLNEAAKLPGVSDLKAKVKVKFLKALAAEERGDHVEAAQLLDEAVAAEQDS